MQDRAQRKHVEQLVTVKKATLKQTDFFFFFFRKYAPFGCKPDPVRCNTDSGPSSDLQHHHEEEVDVGHPVELLKQRHGQESQGGVLVAAHQIVLATKKGDKHTGVGASGETLHRLERSTEHEHVSTEVGCTWGGRKTHRLLPPLEAQEGFLLFVLVVLTVVGPHLPREACGTPGSL